jgi:glycosyltransferase involved in cell wall biosynthesis
MTEGVAGRAVADPGTRNSVAVLVTACDEEDQIGGALASIAGWADEVVVVIDPKTSDGTAAVAAKAGARVLTHPFESSGAQCNWGLDQCTSRYVFVLDADERLTPALGRAITRAVAAGACEAWSVRRVNFALGRRLRFGDWGNDRVVRLVDRRVARFSERAVHGSVGAAQVGRLDGFLEHHTFRTFAQYLPKVDEYARRGATEILAAGGRPGVARAILRGGFRFLRGYLLRLGFLDGGPGLVVASVLAWGTTVKWLRAWEAATRSSGGP